MVAEGGAVAMDRIVDTLAFALCIQQWYADSQLDDSRELVFINFSMIAKSVGCFKQFITAYHAFHTNRLSEMSGFVCLLGFILQSHAITIHLKRKYKSWARTTIAVVATLMAGGFYLLCRGMFIPEDHACNTIAVPAIIIFVVLSEAALLLRSQNSIQENEDGGDQHLLRDLVMKLVEASISIYRWVEWIAQAHSPLDAEKILNLVGGGLPVLIVAYQIAWILYKMGIMCKVTKLLGKIHPVFTGEEEQTTKAAMEADEEEQPTKAAMEADEDGGVEKQMPEGEVELAPVQGAT